MQATISVYAILLLVVLTSSGVDAKNATTSQTKTLRTFLADPSLVLRQINCVLGRAKCDRLGVQLQKAIPEVVNRNCARCTNVQASNARKLITFIQNHYPVAYRDIINKYQSKRAGQRQQAQQSKKNAKPSRSSATQPTARSETAPATSSTKRKSSS